MSSPESIRAALKQIKYPGFSRDIVSFGLVQAVQFNDGLAVVELKVTTADAAVPQKLKADIEAVVGQLPEVKRVDARIAVHAPKGAPVAGGTQGSGGQSRLASLKAVKYIVAVASGKGGVGKSTFASNLACALERLLRQSDPAKAGKVGILDCDIYGPSIPMMMGIADRPEIKEDKIIPPVNFGVKVMSMALLIDDSAPVVWRGPMINNAINQFAQHVEWGELEVLVVDLPPGTGDAQLSLAQTFPVNGAVIVTTPQMVSVQVTTRGARMFEKVNVPIFGVCENMSWLQGPDGRRIHIFGEGGGFKAAEALGTQVLGQVPLDPEIREGADQGIPMVVSYPNSQAGKAFLAIADAVLVKLGVNLG